MGKTKSPTGFLVPHSLTYPSTSTFFHRGPKLSAEREARTQNSRLCVGSEPAKSQPKQPVLPANLTPRLPLSHQRGVQTYAGAVGGRYPRPRPAPVVKKRFSLAACCAVMPGTAAWYSRAELLLLLLLLLVVVVVV